MTLTIQTDCMPDPPPRETPEGREWLRLREEHGWAKPWQHAHTLAPLVRKRARKRMREDVA